MMRSPALFGIASLSVLLGCARNETPSGPRIVIPPSFVFSPGQTLSYIRQNFDQNHNLVSTFRHDVEVLTSGGMIGGLANAATVMVSSSGGNLTRIDTVALAIEGGRLLIYDARARASAGFPPLPFWNTLIDLSLPAAADTLLSCDSTFTVAMASGHILRDRVTCRIETRYVGEEVIPAFGAPVVNSFVFTRTVYCGETVDTAGVLLFQGPVITLLDSVWFADGIGPAKWTSRGNTLEVDSLGLPFSLAPLQVVHTPSSHDSHEVHYARVNGRDSLVLRESLYVVPAVVYTVTVVYEKNF
jgi:hypothetical protein